MHFSQSLKQKLTSAQTLDEAAIILQKEIGRLQEEGYSLGLVVGKITPTLGETLEENKRKLEKLTKEIAHLVKDKKIMVFSSAMIPDHLENPDSVQQFYTIFEQLVASHISVLYTTERWEKSKGASKEVRLAKEKGISVLHYTNGQLVS